MIRPLLLPILAFLIAVSTTTTSRGNDGYHDLGFFGGFYQPYGIRYSTSVRTPPYFAVNPPVYYGARHVRPYGISPFASLPQVKASSDYRSHRRAEFLAPPEVICNPFCEAVDVAPVAADAPADDQPLATGPMRTNPFAMAKVATQPRHFQ